MTDRELLESAARAAGLQLWTHEDGGLYLPNPMRRWNPLEDDGDALRLAVKLGMSVEVHHDESQPRPWLRVVYADRRWEHAMVNEYALDPYAATRRSITRAASAIGEKVK